MKIFLSHTSADKEFVRRLADDLIAAGHTPWLDEWEIRVGECIVTKVQDGLASSDYVAVVLSPEAMASGWVEKEWQSAYWDEIQKKKVVVLPILWRDCEKPALLKTKRHADFTKSYAVGFAQLIQAMPLSAEDRAKLAATAAPPEQEVHRLLSEVQSGSTLSVCIARALPLAESAGDAEFVTFCRNELAGWPGRTGPPHRRFQAFVCKQGPPNPSYIGWHGSAANMWTHIEANPDAFQPVTFAHGVAISVLEANYAQPPEGNTWSQWTAPAADYIESPSNPEARIVFIAQARAGHNVYLAVRAELTRHLLRLLPASPAPSA
jgi:hypothetical protein